MPPFVPADSPGAQAREHLAPFRGFDQHPIDPELPPYPHHAERISAANIDEVGPGDLPCRNSAVPGSAIQQKLIGTASEHLPVDTVEGIAILLVVLARRGDKERQGIFPLRKLHDLSVDRERLLLL